MSAPLLVVDRIIKRFGARTVLDMETLTLDAGASYALTGDNGSGKTTLMRIVAGLEPAQLARGGWLGRPIDFTASPEDFRREVVYVHQHPYLFRRSVRDNIAYGLDVRGASGRERDRLVEAAVQWARLTHALDTPAQRLSAGEKQRVALARAKVLRPRVFLLDEPTANLDAEARLQTLSLVQDLCEADCAVLIACHDPEVLALPGIRRLHLAGGLIEQRPEVLGGLDFVARLAARRSSRPVPGAALDPMLWHPVAND